MKPTIKVTATSAIELSTKQVDKIVKAVEKKYNLKGTDAKCDVEFKQIVDPSVIAGIKIIVGSQETDATVYTKLEKLHAQLRENI